jgi:hypothetical protein
MPRRLLLAAVLAALALAALATSASAASGDLPRLTAGPPSGVTADWYDDHSVIGDDHLSWSTQGGDHPYVNTGGQQSESEPKAVGFDPAVTVSGPGGLEICGYPSGTTGWMRAYQAAPGAVAGSGSCPAAEPATGQFGWFRYVYGRHSPADAYNRWHVMDLERFALVPLPPGQGGPPAGTPTVWDNHWGTCLNLADVGTLTCPDDRAAPRLDVGIPAGATKTTGIYYTSPVTPGNVDQQVIPTPVAFRLNHTLPDGLYQVVDLVNPYGLLQESGGAIGSVSCVTVNFSFGTVGDDYGLVHVPVTDADPADCELPTTLNPMLPGPGGFDPMQGADAIPDCQFTGSHCWPGDVAPTSGPFTAAHSLATGDAAAVATTPVLNGSAIPQAIAMTGRRVLTPRPVVVTPATVPGPRPGPGAPKQAASSVSSRALRIARSHARTALRRVFGRGLSRLEVSCRLRSGGAATCTVSFRKRGARYSGHLYLRNHRVHGRLRWQYRIDVRRHQGHHTTHVKHGYRTGGAL